MVEEAMAEFMISAPVSHIQRYSTKDGPGIRSTLFLAGCSLRCQWCSNPELLEERKQVLHFRSRCQKCGECMRIDSSIVLEEDGAAAEHSLHKEELIAVCPFDAFEAGSEDMDVNEALRILRNDQAFYDSSDGGVTVSGGEPLLHAAFVKALFDGLKQEGISTCIDTAGNVPWTAFEAVRGVTDLFLFDLKAYDSEIHRYCTGSGNELILDNFKRLTECGARLWVRMPVVHGFNDSAQDIRMRLRLLKDVPSVERAEVLCYHEYGTGKYKALGMDYSVLDGFISEETEQMIRSIAEEEGVTIRLVRE